MRSHQSSTGRPGKFRGGYLKTTTMKQLLCICILSLIVFSADAQKRTFIRVFDLNGKKISKGFIHDMSDSSITVLDNKNREVIIPAGMVGTLKLRRSFGHTVLVSTVIAGATFTVVGAVAGGTLIFWYGGYAAVAEGAAVGIVAGTAAGAATGSIIAGTRGRPVFNIEGREENWKTARGRLQIYVPRPPTQMAFNY